MRAAAVAALAGVAVAVATAPGASGQTPLAGYDGANPFNCVLQQAGRGTDFPDPDADPFCVEYDKRHQNVDTLGIVDFLSREPARVAAASDKCFYFQHDHWRSRLLAGSEATQTYNWDGSYYFDLARGVGGVYVENFTLNNRTFDPTTFPGFPDEYRPYFGEGRGGVQFSEGIPVDPRCVEKARRENVYASGAGARTGTGGGAGDAGGSGAAGSPRAGAGSSGGGGSGAAGGGEDPAGDPGFSESRRSPSFTG